MWISIISRLTVVANTVKDFILIVGQSDLYFMVHWLDLYYILCTGLGVCVCIPVLVTTFPEWLSGTEPLPHTPGTVCPSSLCL